MIKKSLFIYFFLLNLTGFASKLPDIVLWKKILKAEKIYKIKINEVDDNKCKVSILQNWKDSSATVSEKIFKYSKRHVKYLGSNWIKEKEEYIVFLRNGCFTDKLNNLHDKMKIQSDSIFISSRTLSSLPDKTGLKIKLYADQDAGNAIGYKLPLLEFKRITEILLGSYYIDKKGNVKAKCLSNPTYNSVLYKFLIDDIQRSSSSATD